MGIRTVNTEAGSVLRHLSLYGQGILAKPSSTGLARFVNETDPTSISVGDELLVGGTVAVPNCGVALGYTDAATFSAVAAVTVTGRNQFGEPVSELLRVTSVDANPLYDQSIHAYSQIDSIILAQMDNPNAADTLTVGHFVTSASNPIVLGVPCKVKGLHEIIGEQIVELVAPNDIGVTHDIVTLNVARSTITIADPVASGGLFYVPFKADVGIDTR